MPKDSTACGGPGRWTINPPRRMFSTKYLLSVPFLWSRTHCTHSLTHLLTHSITHAHTHSLIHHLLSQHTAAFQHQQDGFSTTPAV